MAPNAFIGRTAKPTEADLGQALGRAKPIWDGLISDLASKHDVGLQEWKSYSAKYGWSLRLLRGKRTIVWLSPCNGCFQVMFILGDRAVLAARQSRLPARILHALEAAEKYPEGTGLRLRIASNKDIPAIEKLAAIKMQN